jgi:hypothetical protein
MADFVGVDGGWVEDPEEVARIAAALPVADFSSTPAGVDESELPPHVFLWELGRRVTGKNLPPRNQGSVGSCVAFGTARAIEYTMISEIANGQTEQYRELAPEPIYWGSRVEVGKNRLRGDGSVGAWAAQWVNQFGIVPRDSYEGLDLTVYRESTIRKYDRSGCPDFLEPIAKLHPIRSIARVTSWKDAKRALANGYGIMVCSSRGFTMRRDSDGFCRPSGVWRHALCLPGYQTGKREGGRLDNSWGENAHTGPTGAGNPGPEGFWADADVIDGMLGQGDSWAFSDVAGFPVNLDKIDWRSLI